MIITVFAGIFGFLMVVCGILILLCVIMLALAVFDYLCDTDIKESLVEHLGPRKFLKKVRKNAEDFMYKHDGPSKEDLMTASDEDYRRYLYVGHYEVQKDREEKQGDQLEPKEDFNQTIHNEIDKIFKDAD